ncbi:ABC-F family ATP-binding cassette domain-containing protein [Limnobacter litoralis]|uniref:ABC transporter ATP-binding protein n=2 Tax=Limnobacter TaxID=131079 RepID=A0ABQ5YSE5_9BURK|nr:ATP-binding cassette domain-containing protein [Limnobacter litoralis]GLR26346.1 ABC transporter ATP-binding protein [Limnobacter litoralis]
MIQFNQVTLARGSKTILRDAQATLFPKEKVGLVGLNGAGKSSLLSALLGEISLDQGSIDIPKNWNLAWIDQEVQDVHLSVIEFAMQGDRPLLAVREALDKAQATGNSDALAALYEQMENLDGYAAESRVASILAGLGFKTGDLKRKVGEFSGGWKMRMNLAKVLGSRADLILLDEPTNHLDIDAVLWLEQWIKNVDSTVIVVSHDRDFLDEVCTHTLHLHHEKLSKYTGGYSAFELAFAERAEQVAQQNRKSAEEIQKLQRFVDRFKAKATKAKQAQSRVKRIEKIKLIETVSMDQHVHLEFLDPHKSPDPLVVLNRTDCGYQIDKPILSGVGLEIRPGDRIGLLGANGNGKTTLIRTLVGQLNLLQGERVEGKGLVCGYFAQDQIESLDMSSTPLQHMLRLDPKATEQQLRGFLARFQFTDDKVNQTVEGFSGGEKSRLALALLAYTKPNLLLLDEPTNHLDIATRQALANGLLEFEGALVVVSHDRHLLESTVDTYWRVANGAVMPFDGDLNDYAQVLKQDNTATNQNQGANTSSNRDRQQQRQADHNQLKKAKSQLRKLETKLPNLTEQLAKADEASLTLDYSSQSGQQKAIEVTQNRQRIADELADLEEQLLELMLEIEDLEAQLGLQ